MFHPQFLLPTLVLYIAFSLEPSLSAQPTNVVSAKGTNDPIQRIRDEGLNHSQVMTTLSYLCDVIGPRLTGSPQLKRANEWTRDKLASWGATNAHLESWGPFGRGWSLTRFSAQIVEPQTFPLIACPKAWTPGLDGPLIAPVVYLDAKTEADLEKQKGKLKGAIVLISSLRDVKARFEPPGLRVTDAELLRLANADERPSFIAGQSPPASALSNAPPFGGGGRRLASANSSSPSTNAPPPRSFSPSSLSSSRIISFLAREGAALLVSGSSQGDGGTIFVAAASVPSSSGSGSNSTSRSARGSSPWSTNAPPYPPQISVAVEDYNRLVRMIQAGEKPKMLVELETQFHHDDAMAYNTIAEIAGGELKSEIVMLGAHLDSWHSGTGATDNGAGCAVVMEAMRILKELQLQPRRTIRIGLWSGEEQGLLGSKAYVSSHFGYYTNITNAPVVLTPKDQEGQSITLNSTNSGPRTERELVRQRDYERLSVYFNLDNGTGKIRGIYLQGNEAARPLFRQWLAPFRDLGAETITVGNTGGTDHQSFDSVGLPGFQFIQDPIEYWSRTHHSNADVFDRIQGDDLKQAATIIAAFAWNAAIANDKVPRKPVKPGTPAREARARR